jgi:hypothetical protein
MQGKLVSTWETLQLNTQQRLDFMAKYSSNMVASEMGTAIDMWAEAAVLIAILVEAHSMIYKVQSNILLLPFTLNEALACMSRKIHPFLASPSSNLIPLQLANSKAYYESGRSTLPRKFPLSAMALAQCREVVFTEFEHSDELTELGQVKETFEHIAIKISKLAIDRLRKIQVELDDIILYKDKPFREWLLANGYYSK